MSATCRSCGAAIIWAERGGRRMPLDAVPVDQRGLFNFDNGYALTPRTVYRSHFATCPNAAQHRRPTS